MRYFALGLLSTACAASPAPKPAEPEIPAPPPARAAPEPSASATTADAAAPSSQAPSPPARGRDVGQSCGGIAGLMCKPGLRCVGNPMLCDPHRGGRDCGGVCRAPSSDAGAPAH